MVPNVVKGNGFRGLMNYLLVGRHDAKLLCGNMAATTPLMLTREFGMIRRLRPARSDVVMHHSLSFADGENPDDEALVKIAESYIQKMGLGGHQWVAVVHRDKAHIHLHLAIHRTALDGAWWNATHDWERAQIVAGKIEREIGLVEVPRKRLRAAIDKAIVLDGIAPPGGVETPQIEAPVFHVMDTIRHILEGIPSGLPADQWAMAVQTNGLRLRPSIKGEKLSGFTVQLEGYHPVKLSDVHRSLSWPKLVGSGRVQYNSEHLPFLSKLSQEVRYDRAQAKAPDTTHSTPGERAYDPETGALRWEWQPRGPELVDGPLATGLGPHLAPGIRAPNLGQDQEQVARPGPPAIPRPGPPDGESVSTGIWGPEPGTGDVPYELDRDLSLDGPGFGELLLGQRPVGGPQGGGERDPGVDAGRSHSGARGSAPASSTIGFDRVPDRGGLPGGGVQAGTGERNQGATGSDLGWKGIPGDARGLIGAKVDFEDLGLPEGEIPRSVRGAAKRVIAEEFGRSKFHSEELKHDQVLIRETLWQVTDQRSLNRAQYRYAKGELGKILGVARKVIEELAERACFPVPRDTVDLVLDSYPEPPESTVRPPQSRALSTPGRKPSGPGHGRGIPATPKPPGWPKGRKR